MQGGYYKSSQFVNSVNEARPTADFRKAKIPKSGMSKEYNFLRVTSSCSEPCNLLDTVAPIEISRADNKQGLLVLT